MKLSATSILFNQSINLGSVTSPFIVVYGLSMEVTKNNVTKAYYNKTPFILATYGPGLTAAIEQCLSVLNSTSRTDLLSDIKVLEAFCNGRSSEDCKTKMNIPVVQKQTCTTDIKEDCVYRGSKYPNPHFQQVCIYIKFIFYLFTYM